VLSNVRPDIDERQRAPLISQDRCRYGARLPLSRPQRQRIDYPIGDLKNSRDPAVAHAALPRSLMARREQEPLPQPRASALEGSLSAKCAANSAARIRFNNIPSPGVPYRSLPGAYRQVGSLKTWFLASANR
jgi:hypothetical protein